MATEEDRFRAAVNVIRSMPKSGSFQPSHQLQLKFYSYYKQATEGPCKSARPSFWDVVGRAKYDAWAALGSMSKRDAMTSYVDEFINVFKELEKNATREQIEEAMSTQNETVVKSMETLAPLLAQKGVKRAQDHLSGGTPIKLNGGTSNGIHSSDDDIERIPSEIFDQDGAAPTSTSGGNPTQEQGELDSEGEYEEFSDTNNDLQMEDISERSTTNLLYSNGGVAQDAKHCGGGDPSYRGSAPTGAAGASYLDATKAGEKSGRAAGWRTEHHGRHLFAAGASGSAGGGRSGVPCRHDLEIGEQLAVAVLRLQRTMDLVVARLDTLEALLQQKQQRSRSYFRVSPYLLALIFGWPVLVQLIIFVMRRRARNGQVFMKLL